MRIAVTLTLETGLVKKCLIPMSVHFYMASSVLYAVTTAIRTSGRLGLFFLKTFWCFQICCASVIPSISGILMSVKITRQRTSQQVLAMFRMYMSTAIKPFVASSHLSPNWCSISALSGIKLKRKSSTKRISALLQHPTLSYLLSLLEIYESNLGFSFEKLF